jgi:hypothetical protein
MATMTPDEFWHILHAVPDVSALTYRLYHDEAGQLLFYSMERLPGNYIEIDAATFGRSPSRVRVVNGQLIETKWRTVNKLTPDAVGTRCHPKDIAVIVSTQSYIDWSKKIYEAN